MAHTRPASYDDLMTEQGFDALMRTVCVEWGYCGCMKRGDHLHVTMLIPSSGPVHAAQFVEWLLLADNVNPNLPEYDRHKAALSAAFVTHMGGEVVDAALLRWSDSAPDTDQPDLKYRGRIAGDPRDAADGS
jgi:hypothetical protein